MSCGKLGCFVVSPLHYHYWQSSLRIPGKFSGESSRAIADLRASGHMSQKEFDELGYPKIPDHWTKEWMLEQIELEKVDPRVNPNLLLDETQQEFWDNASRKPYAKAILRSEQHWTKRRQVWLRQYEQTELANMMREELASELETCPPDVKRLVTPILNPERPVL